MTNYWGGLDPLAANTTVTALADGYSIYVPIAGFENNTKTITINATYTSTGVLNKTTFEYGADLLYTYELVSYEFDAVSPVTTSPGDFAVTWDYTGEKITWTATDAHAGNYTITRDGTPVVNTTPWVNGTPVTYNITDGLVPGDYTFEITFTDNYTNFIADSVVMTVGNYPDVTDPVITSNATDLVVNYDYTGQTFSWTATDANPGTYTIKRNGSLVVVSATAWTNSTPVIYNIGDGITASSTTTYEITFSDLVGNSVSHTASLTINTHPDPTPPVVTINPSDLSVLVGYTGESFTWAATDANAGTYTITLDGTIDVTATAWTSGTNVTYNIPDGLALGSHTFVITFSDTYGNTVSDSALVIINPAEDTPSAPPQIPGFDPLIVIGIAAISSIGLIALKKKKK
ncbi:MAG TPA: hypothetical protein ENI29_17105 [bacterium]|nr:hypothetical protein [bacterium]